MLSKPSLALTALTAESHKPRPNKVDTLRASDWKYRFMCYSLLLLLPSLMVAVVPSAPHKPGGEGEARLRPTHRQHCMEPEIVI